MDVELQDEQMQLAMALSRESAGRRRGRFTMKLRAFVAGSSGENFEGNQIRLPATVMSQVFEDGPQGEHVYQIRTVQEHIAFAGVIDYASPDCDSCALSLTMMKQLGLEDGRAVELTLVNATSSVEALRPLPVATELKLRWENCNQYDSVWDLPDAELIALQGALESSLNSSYPVIKLHDLVRFMYRGQSYDMRIVGLRKRAAGSAVSDEEAQVQRVMAQSLGDDPSVDVEVRGLEEVLRLRVPAWDAFDRRLLIDPPPDWIPPRPFPDALWDAARRLYYPAGWVWDDPQQTYVLPPTPELPPLQRARTGEVAATEEPDSFGVGQVLGGAAVGSRDIHDRRPLTQEEMRQQRIRAMEQRMKENDAPIPPDSSESAQIASVDKRARWSEPGGETTVEHKPAVQCGSRAAEEFDARTFQVRKDATQAAHDIAVEVDFMTINNYFRKFRSSAWACTWAYLYGTVHTDESLPEKPLLPKSTIFVQAIWEPPQLPNDNAFTTNGKGLGTPPRLLRASAERAAACDAAAVAGLSLVGWLLTCPPREKGFTLRTEEVLNAAFLQLEQADGYTHGEPPFVTLRLSTNSLNSCVSHEPQLELSAWCATQQAMELRAKGFFETRAGLGSYRNAAKVAEGFRVVHEGRTLDDVDTSLLHRPLPLRQRSGGLTLDLQAISAPSKSVEHEIELEPEQVTRWAPPEISERPISECLRRVAAVTVDAQRDCCETLLKLFGNVISKPDELKFRRLKKSNKILESKVLSVVGAEDLLFASGWHVEGDSIVLPKEARLSVLELASNKLRGHLATLTVTRALPPATEVAQKPEVTEWVSQWVCSVCTLVNSGTASACDVCGNSKP